MRALLRLILATCLLASLLGPLTAQDQPTPKPNAAKPVAGKADVMKHVRKKFATMLQSDPAALKVRLKIEGDEQETSWPLLPDAEVKIHGWWGRLDQLRPQDRVWVWFAVDRDKKPQAILMIADEMSEQDIHGEAPTIKASGEGKLTLHVPDEKKVPVRELEASENYAGPREVGTQIYAQTSGGAIREAVTATEFEALRSVQQDFLRERCRKEGLAGTVSVLHPLGGEMEVLLDHEAMRWGRYLKNGDEVTLKTKRPIKATVHTVRTWRERTRLRLVTESGLDQMDLALGQRLGVLVPEPPEEVQASHLPTDMGRLEGKDERVEWFLDTIYCSCGIQGDRCTGMFYTQASCNINACGMPKIIAGEIAEMIEKGQSDGEIFAALVKEKGRDLWQPHLLR